MPQFQIRKDRFASHQTVATDATAQHAAIAEGEILVEIERFAFSANNMTYAILGDALGYWQFFPAIGDNARAWGVTPVWGFADVVLSKSPEIAVGERLFGYFPPASLLTIKPVRVSAQRLFDGAPHRAKFASGYNSYSRVNFEAGYDARMDNYRMLLWPLYVTAFCLWDMLQERQWLGAEQILILSASSKTSIGLAYALAADSSAPLSVGVTAPRNAKFVEQLGLYGAVVCFDNLNAINAERRTLIVDMSGNLAARAELYALLGANMLRCINVGLTHGANDSLDNNSLAQADDRSEFFFAPAQVQKRSQDWGVEGFAAKSSEFIAAASRKSSIWLKLIELDGLEAFAALYPEVVSGQLAPDQGLIVKM